MAKTLEAFQQHIKLYTVTSSEQSGCAMAKPVSLESGYQESTRFFWKITNAHLQGECYSNEFSLLGSRWKLWFFHDDHPVIYLLNIDENKSFRAFTAISFIDTTDRSTKFYKSTLVKECNGWKTVWEYKTSAEDAKLLSGVMTFVLLCTPIDANTGGNDTDKPIQTPVFMDTSACLNSLSFDFLNFLEDCAQHDIELKCNGTTIPANRTILSARSPVFAAMFRTEMAENLKGCIEVLDISPSILHQLLKYIYSAKMSDLSEETAPYLYEAADKYAIQPLKKVCANFMVEHLTKENACSHLVLFDAHSDGGFKENVISFIVDKEEIIMDASWQMFCKNYPTLACEVFSRAFTKKCSVQDNSSES